jgi:hypothetical protein
MVYLPLRHSIYQYIALVNFHNSFHYKRIDLNVNNYLLRYVYTICTALTLTLSSYVCQLVELCTSCRSTRESRRGREERQQTSMVKCLYMYISYKHTCGHHYIIFRTMFNSSLTVQKTFKSFFDLTCPSLVFINCKLK